MKRDKRAMRQGAGVIQDELARIEAEIASLGQSLGSTASSEARAALSSIRERLDRIAGSAGGMTRAGVDAVEETIEDNPFTSLAIAFGGAHAPQLSLAAVGASILAWIAWSIIKRKTAALSESANTGPDHPAGPHRTAESLENGKNPTDGAQTRDTAARN